MGWSRIGGVALVFAITAIIVMLMAREQPPIGYHAVQQRVDFPILLPCYLPEGVPKTPGITLAERLGVSAAQPPAAVITYRWIHPPYGRNQNPRRPERTPYPHLRIYETRDRAAEGIATWERSGHREQVGDTQVTVATYGPGDRAELRWSHDGVRFTINTSFPSSEGLKVADSIMNGCGP
jgi:hypothetical protein